MRPIIRVRVRCAFIIYLLVSLTFCAHARTDDPAGENLPASAADDQSESGVDWGAVLWQSLFFTGVEHGFRLGTQSYTRDALQGKFFPDWGRSIGNLHGWGDGDPFLTNYIGHPMQGAVSAFIFAQNDRKYKRVEFGRNREYWKSRLRATLFSFAFSEQFELGLLSEATIGNTQSYYPQQGLVDQVITPTVGMLWMIGEDSIDKYIVQRFEAKTDKPWVKMMLRAGLNPSRSMANAMRLEVPWQRDTRPGIFKKSQSPLLAAAHPLKVQSLNLLEPGAGGVKSTASQNAPPPLNDLQPMMASQLELSTSYSYFQLAAGKQGALACNGGGASMTYNFNSWFGLTADVSGCKMLLSTENLSGDSLTYLLGPRFAWRKWRRWTPYVQVLAGGNKFSFERFYPDRVPPDLPHVNPGDPDPSHSLYTSQEQTNAFAMGFGGGLDFSLNRVFAIHAVELQDVHTWARAINGTHYPNNVRISTGVSLHFGNW
jgi:hypothetical protein